VDAGRIPSVHGVNEHVYACGMTISETVLVSYFRDSRECTPVHRDIDVVRRARMVHVTRTDVQEHGKAADDPILNSRALHHGMQTPDGVIEFADMYVVHGERNHLSQFSHTVLDRALSGSSCFVKAC
jgi:hypothetical protein